MSGWFDYFSMTLDEAKSLFTLAGIPVLAHWELVNGYWGRNDRTGSWWLLKTPRGLIRIGRRKRVIEIDWTDTDLRKVVTADEVTKDQTSVHAWEMLKAAEYLKALWSNNHLSDPKVG